MSLVNTAKKQAGLGMIESLMALVIISIGLLGIASLQITGMQQSSSAQWHSQAVWYSYEMIDRINANRSAFDQYANRNTDGTTATDCLNNPCTPAQMLEADLDDWANLVSLLPGGKGEILQPEANTLQVSIMWDDNSGESNCLFGEGNSTGQTCYTVTIAQ